MADAALANSSPKGTRAPTSPSSKGLMVPLSPSSKGLSASFSTLAGSKSSWRVSNHPEPHSSLGGHLLGQGSRMGTEQWMHQETVVGTKAWIEAHNGSYKRGAKNPERHHWIAGSDQGAILGEPSQIDPPVFGWQPPGGSRWSPNRHPSGQTMEEFRRSQSPQSGRNMSGSVSSPTAGSNANPASPEGVESPAKKNLFRAAGRAAQISARMSPKSGGDPGSPGRRMVKETTAADGATKSARSYADDSSGQSGRFGMGTSTSLPSLTKGEMKFPPPAAYIRCVERTVGTPCSRR